MGCMGFMEVVGAVVVAQSALCLVGGAALVVVIRLAPRLIARLGGNGNGAPK